jgi:hypothetical protein
MQFLHHPLKPGDHEFQGLFGRRPLTRVGFERLDDTHQEFFGRGAAINLGLKQVDR